MLLGARQFFKSRSAAGWQNPYVTDGLIAMWDGIWNAGYDLHDDNISNWVDLMGGEPCALTNHTVTSNGMQWLQSWRPNGTGGSFNRIFPNNNVTFEVVCSNVGAGTSTRFLFQSGCAAITDISLNIAYAGGNIAPVCSQKTNGPCFADGTAGMLGGTYALTSGDGIDTIQMSRNATPMEKSIQSRWNIQQPWGACLMYRGTDYTQAVAMSAIVHGIRVYNRALTAAEIAANYAIDKARFNLP